jgi:hypothetical protein
MALKRNLRAERSDCPYLLDWEKVCTESGFCENLAPRFDRCQVKSLAFSVMPLRTSLPENAWDRPPRPLARPADIPVIANHLQ